MVNPLPPVGPPVGPIDLNNGPIQSFVPVDVVSPAGNLKYVFNASAQKPTLSMLDALKKVGTAKIEDVAEQFKGEAQQAELRKEFYKANADTILTGAQRGQLLLQITINQLTLSLLSDIFFNANGGTINAENAQVNSETSATNLLNSALANWNNARANYIANPTPGNLTLLQNATTNYSNARTVYENFRSTRNSQIDSYNAAITPAQNELDTPGGINDLKEQLNIDRETLGLADQPPDRYDLIRPQMPAAPAVPDISVPSSLPPDLVPLIARTAVDITSISLDVTLSTFVQDIVAASALFAESSIIGRRFADETARELDRNIFVLKKEENPAIVIAFNRANPKVDAKPVAGSESNGAGAGSSAVLAAMSTPASTPSLREAPGIATYTAQSERETILDTPQDQEAKIARINADLAGIGSVRLQDIKLVASIVSRERLGTGFGINNPALRSVLGLNTVNGIQNLLSSGNIDKTVNDIINQNYSDNPELGQAVRANLTSALKIQYQFVAANELAQALGDPNIAALILLATPGLEQLRTLLPGSSTIKLDDILSGPFNELYLGVNLADRLNREADLDQDEAVDIASIILRELGLSPIENLEQLRQALIDALQQNVSADIASKIVDGILTQISQDRNVASLNRPLIVEAIRREAIIDQVTADAAEKAALLNAFNLTFATAQELNANAAVQLSAIGLTQERANLLAENLARVSVLDSAVRDGLNDRLKQINNPGERNRIENEFLSTINIPQKAKVEAKEERLNPLSIPSQIAHQIEVLNDRGADKVITAIIDDSKRAAREESGDFVERHRAEDLGRIYLHQTMEAGGPFADKSALPRNNFTQPSMPIGPTTMAV